LGKLSPGFAFGSPVTNIWCRTSCMLGSGYADAAEPPAALGVSPLDALDVAPGAPGALDSGVLGPEGRICDVIESGPNKWITMPDGFSGGSWRAAAEPAQSKARAVKDKVLSFNNLLQRRSSPAFPYHRAMPSRVKARLSRASNTRENFGTGIGWVHEYPRPPAGAARHRNRL
jgi:hypothetical protein